MKKHFYLLTYIFSAFLFLAPANSDIITALGPNLVKNGGFEQGVANWYVPTKNAQVVANEAQSGSKSLYYDNTNKDQYKAFTQKINVSPGDHLVFSAWIKVEKILDANGAGIYIESFDDEGKWVGGNKSTTITDKSDWKLIRAEYTVPQVAVTTRIGLYLRRHWRHKGATGIVWFDDVEVRLGTMTPFSSYLLYPNYRGTIVVGDKTPWKYRMHIITEPGWKEASLHVITQLNNSSGKVLLRDSKSVLTAPKHKTIDVEFPPPPDLDTGKYTLTQHVIAPDGNKFLLNDRTIRVVKKMPEVYVDADGFTVVDGERFFPMGIYLLRPDETTDAHLRRIKKGGFNTILTYGFGDSKMSRAYLNRAQKHRLKVIYSLKDMYPGIGNNDETLFNAAREHLIQLRNEPALLAWYINDELGLGWLDKLQKMYDMATQIDPNHPAYQVLNRSRFRKYFPSTDILGGDPYPIGNLGTTNLGLTSVRTREVLDSMYESKGTWMVLQLHDLGIYYKLPETHAPSLDEMRNQAYQALINGTKGLMWYSYFDLWYVNSERKPNEAYFLRRWKDVANMAKEIDKITPTILQDQKVLLNISAKSDVEAAAWKQGNKLAILFANPYYETKSIAFALPQGWKIKDAEQGQIKSTFLNGKVTFTLPSLGSGVFYLTKG